MDRSFNVNNASFDHIPYIDADPNLLVAEMIHSTAKRISILLFKGFKKCQKRFPVTWDGD